MMFRTFQLSIIGGATAIIIAFSSIALANGFQGYIYALDPVLKKHIQKALRDKGFSPGPVDGKFGKRSTAALMAFRKNRNIFKGDDIDGVLTPRLAKELLGIELTTGDDGEDLSSDEQLKVLESLGLIKSAEYWRDYVDLE